MHKILELLNVPMLMEPKRFHGFLDGYRIHHPLATEEKRARKIVVEKETLEIKASIADGFPITQNGIAVIQVSGPIYKGYGAYGYADQSEICAAMSMCGNDPNVSGVMLLMDTPGGSVAGTADCGDMIAAVGKAKPVHAYVEDLCASAGMWLASQAAQISAGRTAVMGSIGVITSMIDATKYFEGMGIIIKNITTGNYKDVGDPARKMTDDDEAYMQGRIDALFSEFKAAVSSGRGIRQETIQKMQAALYVGPEAVEAKLCDKIQTFAQAMSDLGRACKNAGGNKRAKAMLALEEAAG